MKKVKRWRYYCDFCKKSGGSKYHMERHENTCTMNPNRDCNMCEYSGGSPTMLPDIIQVVMDNIETAHSEGIDGDFIEWQKFKDGITEQSVIEKIEVVSGCPACFLAAIRQTKTTDLFPSFDFKERKNEMFEEHNEDRRKQCQI